MKIKSITLNNIGCFSGKKDFDLDTTNDKNIIYVEGEHCSGRTTIYRALELGIYGSYLSNLNKNLYNSKTKKLIENKPFLNQYIRVVININNKDYVLRRSWVITDQKQSLREVVICNEFKQEELFDVFCDNEILSDEESKILLDNIYNEMPYDLFDVFYFTIKTIIEIGRNPKVLQSLIKTVFNIDLNNQIEVLNILDKISQEANTLVESSYYPNNFTLNIDSNYRIILKDDEENNLYPILSSSDEQLINYIIVYSMIKLSKKAGLVIFDEPFSMMDIYTSAYLMENIIPNISNQVLLLNLKREFAMDAKKLTEFDEHIYKKYYLDCSNNLVI